MLIRSVSVHEDSLRLDYCRLDSADACYRFYAAATLPITGEVTESNTFAGQVYAVDSPTNFAAKIRSGQIMLYVYTTQEGKADVLAFLELAAGGANKRRKSHIRDAKGIKNKAGRSLTCQPDSFGVDGYLLRPMAPRYTRREFSALERGLLRLSKRLA